MKFNTNFMLISIISVILLSISGTTECDTVNNVILSSTEDVERYTIQKMAEDDFDVFIEYEKLKYAVGEGDIIVHCKTTVNQSSVEWYDPDGSWLGGVEYNNSRFKSENGWLNISEPHVNDTGEYTCIDTLIPGLNQTITLDVFVMPDYFIAGMVVFSINIVLVCLFFACLCYKTVSQKRQSKKYKDYKKTPDMPITQVVTEVDPVKNVDPENKEPSFKPHNKRLDV